MSEKLDRLVLEARRAADKRAEGYREKPSKDLPVDLRPLRPQFTHTNLRELTVHHRDHNHDNNPPDGSNWELCVYCHDNEHQSGHLTDGAVIAVLLRDLSARRKLA